MILDQPQTSTFRKTIQGFIPSGVSSKMAFQYLPLPDSLSSIRRINIEVQKQIAGERVRMGTLRVNGKELNKSLTHRKKVKSTNQKNRIKNINVVMESPEKFVNTLVNLNERQSLELKDNQYEKRIQVKTPKQIITAAHRSLASESRILSKYGSEINCMGNPEDQDYYERMILEDPLLFKKVMLAYNASKREAEKTQAKINIRKIINRTKQAKSLFRPSSLFNKQASEADQKRMIALLHYREFQIGINLSNRQVVVPAQQILYKAYICKGNNGILLKSILKTRPWWSVRTRGQIDSCNLVWTEWKRTRTTNNMPSRNAHFNDKEPPSADLTIKSKMRQMRLLAQKKQDQIKKIAKVQDDLWHYNEKTTGAESYFSFGKKLAEGKVEETLASLCENKQYHLRKIDRQQKIVNHVPGCLSLHSKKHLFHNLKHYYARQGKDIFSVVPLTFHITKGVDDPEFIKFAQYFEEEAKKYKSKKGHNIWICKPGQNSNRGNGISVSNSLSEIKALANQKCSPSRSLIIQKYFENPFLYNKRKFDIRCFILITTINGIIKGYWYEEGYLRTASKQFSLKNLENKYIHLTNDAIQKKSQEYGKFESCNKIFYSDFEKYLEANHPDEPVKFGDVVQKMKEISTDLIHSVATQLNPQRKQYCFQIFGLDFMLDHKLNPYLIEANSNPCITVDGNILGRIIPSMLENVMRVAIDPVFPPPLTEFKIRYPYSNHFESNKFALVYDSYFDQCKLESGISLQVNEADEQEIQNQDQVQQ